MTSAVGDRAALDVGRGLDQLALQPAGRDRQQHRFDPDLGHALGQRHRLAHRLFAFGEIDHRAGLDAARLDLAVSDQLDGMGAPAQGLVRRARLQPRDHAGDLAGADIERGHQRGALLRHRARLRRLVAIKAGHASPAFFFGFLSLNSSSRALAASSDNCTVSRSGSRMSTATISRENSRSSLSSVLSARQRVADVVFRQPDIETVLEPQVPAPLADENRGLGHRAHLRIARQQRQEIPGVGFGALADHQRQRDEAARHIGLAAPRRHPRSPTGGHPAATARRPSARRCRSGAGRDKASAPWRRRSRDWLSACRARRRRRGTTARSGR